MTKTITTSFSAVTLGLVLAVSPLLSERTSVETISNVSKPSAVMVVSVSGGTL